jgi:hypothetical protein
MMTDLSWSAVRMCAILDSKRWHNGENDMQPLVVVDMRRCG